MYIYIIIQFVLVKDLLIFKIWHKKNKIKKETLKFRNKKKYIFY